MVQMEIMDIAEEFPGDSTVEQFASYDDKGFCSFYYKAIKRLLDIDVEANAFCLRRYFKIFCEYFDFGCQVKSNLEDPDETIISLLKDSLYYRLAFIYRDAALLSSAVAFHFRNIYKNSSTNINRLLKKRFVKICSFGGCAVSDIVAIVRVLESIAVRKGIELDFRITILEPDARWEITCITTLSCLEQFHKATWKITFIRANLAKNNDWTPETCKAIREADIVTMIKFFSMHQLNKKNVMKNFQKFSNLLQPQAMLFLLDHPKREIIELSFEVTDSDGFELIHLVPYDFHPLDLEATKQMKTLYLKPFGNHENFKIPLFFNVFISVWIKVSPESAKSSQDRIEYIFQNHVEKYNPKRSFLSNKAFTRWENLFTTQQEAAGWSKKGIRKTVLDEKDIRNALLVDIIDQKKEIDALQNNFLSKHQSLKEDEKESDEEDENILESYLSHQRRYASIKRTIYLYSLRRSKFN